MAMIIVLKTNYNSARGILAQQQIYELCTKTKFGVWYKVQTMLLLFAARYGDFNILSLVDK